MQPHCLLNSRRFAFTLLLSALTAYTLDAYLVLGNIKVILCVYLIVKTHHFTKLHIKDLFTAAAYHMKMRICPAVKTNASVRAAYFLQYAVFRKLIEITVNCTEADFRITASGYIVDLLGGRVDRIRNNDIHYAISLLRIIHTALLSGITLVIRNPMANSQRNTKPLCKLLALLNLLRLYYINHGKHNLRHDSFYCCGKIKHRIE